MTFWRENAREKNERKLERGGGQGVGGTGIEGAESGVEGAESG